MNQSPVCGHSACRQNFIDNGDDRCIAHENTWLRVVCDNALVKRKSTLLWDGLALVLLLALAAVSVFVSSCIG